MKLLTLATFALVGVITGCGGAAITPPPSVPDDPAGEDAVEEETTVAKGEMTDVPGEDAAEPVPDCPDKDACNNMGVFAAMSGKGNVAAALLQKACDLGNGTGCSNLANLYSAGEVIPKNQAKAAALDIRGCELGESKACVNAALAHFDGIGVAKDLEAAHDYFKKGCDLGHAESCKNTGVLHWEGQDHARAVSYFEKACTGGDKGGCFNLGVAYYKGLGVTRDSAKARDYFDNACSKGDSAACDLRDELDAESSGGGGGKASITLNVGSMTANGMTVNDLQCALSSSGFMVAIQLVGAIAGQKKALDRCAPSGDSAKISWTMSGGKITDVRVTDGKNARVDKCVAKATKKMKTALEGTCSAVFLIGKEKGAKAAYDKKFGAR